MPGDLQISTVAESDVSEVSRFLRETFGADEHWMPFRPEVVRWKALAPHPLWEGSRGYLMKREGEIVGHGCAVPTRLVHPGGETLVACIVDWAARKTAPGVGVAIYQHIGKLAEGLIGVGGSDDAHRVLPRLGFKTRQELETFSRVVRPLSQFLGIKQKSWRDVARLGRNVLRHLRPLRASAGGWSARHVERFDETVASGLPRPGLVSATVCYREPAVLNYFLSCPAAKMDGFLLECEGRVKGYFVTASAKRERRIAEIWVASPSPADWAAAMAVATQACNASQISLACGTAIAREAAALAGFYVVARQPVYVKDSKNKLPEPLDAALGMADTDAFYL